MRRSLLVSIGLVTLLSAPASAQLGRFPTGRQSGVDDPKWWGSIWGGYQWSNAVDDERSAGYWDFDAGWVIRGTFEREIGRQTAIGVAFNYVRVPLTFESYLVSGSRPPGTPQCATCDATATIASFGLLLRSGGGRGLHPVFEGFLGAMQFSKFEFKVASAQPSDPIEDTDFAFAVGTGFGYALSRDFQLIALYELSRNVHERSRQTQGGRVTQHHGTRVGLRVGF
jgi:opacity protein-like surface antigen